MEGHIVSEVLVSSGRYHVSMFGETERQSTHTFGGLSMYVGYEAEEKNKTLGLS